MKCKKIVLTLTAFVMLPMLSVVCWQAIKIHRISELREAIRSGDRPHVTALISTHPSLLSVDVGDSRRATRLSPLSLAASLGKYEIAVDLLQFGADVRSLDKFSWSPLHYAVAGGDLRIVKLLISHNADVEQRETTGLRPMDLAEHLGSSQEIKDILMKADQR